MRYNCAVHPGNDSHELKYKTFRSTCWQEVTLLNMHGGGSFNPYHIFRQVCNCWLGVHITTDAYNYLNELTQCLACCAGLWTNASRESHPLVWKWRGPAIHGIACPARMEVNKCYDHSCIVAMHTSSSCISTASVIVSAYRPSMRCNAANTRFPA